jgi:hypothetical protein
MTASDIQYLLDPVLWAKEQLGFIADPWQETFLRSSKNLHVLVSRQCGKTTVSAVKCLHRASFYPRSSVVLISPTLRQSILIAQKITDFINEMKPRPELTTDSTTIMQFKNGSRITSLPGGNSDTVRGFSCDLLIEDEAARVSEDAYVACKPFVATTGGQVILCSTANGHQGHFYVIGTAEDTEWQRLIVPATECPRIPAGFLAAEKLSMDSHTYGQEYCCEWGQNEQALWGEDLIEAIFSECDGTPAPAAIIPNDATTGTTGLPALEPRFRVSSFRSSRV